MRILSLLSALFFMGTGHVSADPLPSPWTQYGMNEYESGIMTSGSYEGSACAFIKSRTDSDGIGGGRLWQAFEPSGKWLEKRIRMSAHIKTVNVKNAAGMYLKIYTKNYKISDFMLPDRALSGNTDWARYEIVAEIPYDSVMLSFGVWLEGSGEVRVDAFKFEIVGSDVKITATRSERQFDEPVNLNFEGKF